ncbi:unnamed protein product, partial [Rotaria sordida]
MATKETTYSWKRNILTTGLSTSSLSTITPVTESNSDTQFRTQVRESICCALPCLMLTIATAIAVPILLIQTATGTVQAMSTTTTTPMSCLATTCTLTINAVWNMTGTTVQPTFPLLTPR